MILETKPWDVVVLNKKTLLFFGREKKMSGTMVSKDFIMKFEKLIPITRGSPKVRCRCRSEGNHGSEFGVIGNTRTLISIRPGPIKDVFSITVILRESDKGGIRSFELN